MRAGFVALAGAVLIASVAAAWAHDPDPGDGGVFDGWFVAQRQPSGAPCCGVIDSRGGDAHYVAVKSDGAGGYLVEVEGHWIPYPGQVDPYILNPTGRDVAWYDGTWPDIFWYCLRLSGGS